MLRPSWGRFPTCQILPCALLVSCLCGTLPAEQARLPSPAHGRGAGGEGRRPLAPDQRKAALEAARAEALPYWVMLIEKFPQSRHLPEALFHAGSLYSEGPKNDPAKSVACFERLVKEFPNSPWTGDAHVRLIDVCLEQGYDLPAAEQHIQAAVKWLAEQVASGQLSVASDGKQLPTDHRPLPTAYSIYLRAGLIEYLQERSAKAVEWFEKAKPFAPPRDFVVVHGTIPTGIERVIEAAKAGKSLTPEAVRNGNEKVRLVLQLGDIFLEAAAYEKALDLAGAATTDLKKSCTSSQSSWAHRQRALAFAGLRMVADAKSEYLTSQRAAPSAAWAPECLLFAGTITHNYEKQRPEARALFEEVVRRYPKSEAAAKAAYFVGVIHEWNSEWEQAKAAYQRVIRDYPESRWASAAMDYHMKKVDAALAAAKPEKKRGR